MGQPNAYSRYKAALERIAKHSSDDAARAVAEGALASRKPPAKPKLPRPCPHCGTPTTNRTACSHFCASFLKNVEHRLKLREQEHIVFPLLQQGASKAAAARAIGYSKSFIDFWLYRALIHISVEPASPYRWALTDPRFAAFNLCLDDNRAESEAMIWDYIRHKERQDATSVS